MSTACSHSQKAKQLQFSPGSNGEFVTQKVGTLPVPGLAASSLVWKLEACSTLCEDSSPAAHSSHYSIQAFAAI